MNVNDLEILSWYEVEKEVGKVNQKIAGVVNELQPSKEAKVIKACYSYGMKILDQGTLQLPYKGKLYPIGSKRLPKDINELLSYAVIPLGLPLDKFLEIFFEYDNSIVPFAVYHPGKIFGIWNMFDDDFDEYHYNKYWNMSAGNRSLYSLSKISDERKFNKLRRHFNLEACHKPSDMCNQWNLFKDISNSESQVNNWTVDVLFFSKHWLENDKKLKKFKSNLLDVVWGVTKFLRVSQLVKFNISQILGEIVIKPNPYIVSMLNQLYATSISFSP